MTEPELFINLSELSNKKLIEFHSYMHDQFLNETDPDRRAEIIEVHKLIVLEATNRGCHHRIKDSLDESPVNSPEPERIYLSDVSEYLKTPDIELVKPFVYLVGGICEIGWSDNDIDILIRAAETDIALEYRISMLFPERLQPRLHFLYDDELKGPIGNFIPIFSKSLKQVNPELSLSFMSKKKGDSWQVPENVKGMTIKDLEKLANFQIIADLDRGEQGHYQMIFANDEFFINDEGVIIWRSSDTFPDLAKEVWKKRTGKDLDLTEWEKRAKRSHNKMIGNIERYRKPMNKHQKVLYSYIEPEMDRLEQQLLDIDYPNIKIGKESAEEQVNNLDLDIDYFKAALILGLSALALESYKTSAAELKQAIPTELPETVLNRINSVSDTLTIKIKEDALQSVKQVLKQGIEVGESPILLRKRVSDMLKQGFVTKVPAKIDKAGKIIREAYELHNLPKYRAEMIAKTEATNIVNNSYIMSFRKDKRITGWRRKIASGNPCEACLAEAGIIHKMSDDFEVLHPNESCIVEPVFNKQAHASLYPDETKKWRFVLQNHFRAGGSIHTDFRYQVNDKDLNGWTLFTQKAGKLKTPIETISAAKSFNSNYSNYLKINNEPGMGGKKIQTVKKGKMNKPWLNFEGVVEPGGTGATKEGIGVFSIFDKGWLEFGRQSIDFNEYFLHGKKFNGRWIATTVDINGKKTSLFWKPKEQLPYVLTDASFVPPKGLSALPKEWRRRVPKDLKWWVKGLTGTKAREDIDAIRKMETRHQLTNSRFKLYERSSTSWSMDINTGSEVITLVLSKNPILNHKCSTSNKKVMLTGKELDSGSLEIINKNDDFMSMRLSGNYLEGYYMFKRLPGKGTGIFKKTQLPISSSSVLKEIESFSKSMKHSTVLNRIEEFKKANSYHRFSAGAIATKYEHSWPRVSDIPLPLKISGMAIQAGTWQGMDGSTVTYTNKTIEKAQGMFTGIQFRDEHNETDQDAVLGFTTKDWLEYDIITGKAQIWYDALVFDYNAAKDIVERKRNDVSVGVWNYEEKDEHGDRIAEEIRKADEISLCKTGAVDGAFSKPDLAASRQIQEMILKD